MYATGNGGLEQDLDETIPLQALESNRLIATAMGLLMERHHLTRATAFAHLTRLSQDSNTKMVEIARSLVAAAED